MTRTESGKYSRPTRNCCSVAIVESPTDAAHRKKRIIWRSISWLDYGTKYCKDSPTVDEIPLQNAIAHAIKKCVEECGISPVENLKNYVQMYYRLYDDNSTAAEELRRQERAHAIMDAARGMP